ncbi:MAG: cytochrome c1 [Gammaproteobacteria bacterium]|nr:cytochrome c1 [Gammaproteobacteria bacterium]
MKSLLFLLLSAISASSLGAGAGLQLLEAKVDLEDNASLQRGAKLFVNYCMGCHSLKFMRYQRMGEDLGISDDQLKANLLFAAEKVGERMDIALSKEMGKAWFGVAPPDLSLTGRSRGADWLYSYLLTFYADDNPSRPFGVNNLVFPDVGMPHVLWSLQGYQEYVKTPVEGEVVAEHVERLAPTSEGIAVYKAVEVDDGQGHHETHHVVDELRAGPEASMSPGEYRDSMKDLVNFLVYASEPGKLARTSLGVWVLVFIAFFFALARLLKKEYWKDVH